MSSWHWGYLHWTLKAPSFDSLCISYFQEKPGPVPPVLWAPLRCTPTPTSPLGWRAAHSSHLFRLPCCRPSSSMLGEPFVSLSKMTRYTPHTTSSWASLFVGILATFYLNGLLVNFCPHFGIHSLLSKQFQPPLSIRTLPLEPGNSMTLLGIPILRGAFLEWGVS